MNEGRLGGVPLGFIIFTTFGAFKIAARSSCRAVLRSVDGFGPRCAVLGEKLSVSSTMTGTGLETRTDRGFLSFFEVGQQQQR